MLPVSLGARPVHGDALWVRTRVHDHYLATQRARQELEAVAQALSISAPEPPGGTGGPVRCGAPARAPVVSWDGKVALCPSDVLLSEPLGEITPGSLAEIWRGAGRAAAVAACDTPGRPDRDICRSCGRPEAPHIS